MHNRIAIYPLFAGHGRVCAVANRSVVTVLLPQGK